LLLGVYVFSVKYVRLAKKQFLKSRDPRSL